MTWAKVTNFPNVGNYVQDATSAYLGGNQGVLWVTFDPTTGSAGTATKTIYVGVADKDSSVYRTTDGGTTWERVAGQPTGYLPHKGVFDKVGKQLYIATSDTGGPYDGAKGDVWRLDTATGVWTQISPIASSSTDDYFGYSGLTIDRQHPDTIMVTTQVSWWPDVIIFRSTDRGATWSRIWDWNGYPSRTLRYNLDITGAPWLTFGKAAADPEPSPKLGWMTESLEIDPFNANRALYGTGATIYGTDNLLSWDTSGGKIDLKVTAQGIEETAVLDLAAPPGSVALVSGLGDIGGFVHTDITKVPSSFSTQPTHGSVNGVDFAALSPSTMVRVGAVPGIDGDVWLAGGSATGSYGLWHSTTSGATFTQLAAVDQGDNVGFGKAAPGKTYPVAYTSSKINGVRGIFRSKDA